VSDGGVTGWDLYSTLALQAEYATFYKSQPPTNCPRCGEPLTIGPATTPGILFCRWGHFEYPRDWDPETMSGM
jgi:hypothetical protein